VPIDRHKLEQHNRSDDDDDENVLPSSLILLEPMDPISIASKDRSARLGTSNTRSDETVRSCLQNIPPVPPGYTYSIRQRAQQFKYFKEKLDINRKPDETTDIFNVAIITLCK
jgi:hypothetical protein